MTDAHLVEANCIHGIVWYDCEQCTRDIHEGTCYERCTDPNCTVSFAFRNPFPEAEHFHFTGSVHHPGSLADGADLFDRWSPDRPSPLSRRD